MESPSATGDTKKVVARSSIVDSLRGYGLSGMRIDKDDLKKQLTMPQYLRFAMRDSIRLQDPAAKESRYRNRADGEDALLLPVPWSSSLIPAAAATTVPLSRNGFSNS